MKNKDGYGPVCGRNEHAISIENEGLPDWSDEEDSYVFFLNKNSEKNIIQNYKTTHVGEIFLDSWC